MTLHYVSLFSGIEAFSVAASRCQEADFKPVFFSEIDPFPCAVLAHHYPNTPNLGDICKIRIDHDTNTATNGTTTVALPRTGIDILAGGSPCQDVSVAGRRAGMSEGSGTRSALAFEYARLVEELRPRVILWENVPGVLSSNGGLDFAAFLDSLVKRGYGLAWRVLDAQYVRVDGFPRAIPQRRKRVWLVGCLGADERTAAQILFERQGLCGDSAPRREAGKGFACPAGYISSGDAGLVGGAGFDMLAFDKYGDGGAGSTVKARDFKDATDLAVAPAPHSGSFDGEDCAATLHKPNGAPGQSDQELFAQKGAYLARVATYENHGQDSRIRPIEVSDTRNQKDETGGNNLPLVVEATAFGKIAHASGKDGEGERWDSTATAQTLNVHDGASSTRAQDVVAAGFNTCASTRYPDGGAKVEAAGTLAVNHREGCAIGIDIYNKAITGSVSKTIGSAATDADHVPCAMLKVRCGADTYIKRDGSTGTAGKGALASEESAFTLSATQDQSLVLRHIVRRLTPIEAERLQGFPDNYTRIPYRNKPAEECPDSPRYKALGNSWATNCAEWILRRIAAAFRLGMI